MGKIEINIRNLQDACSAEVKQDIINGDDEYVGDFYIGRGSMLGNEFRIEEYGRDGCIAEYRKWLWSKIKDLGYNGVDDQLFYMSDIARAGFKINLWCYCAPLNCHGEVIKSCLEWIMEHEIYDEATDTYELVINELFDVNC